MCVCLYIKCEWSGQIYIITSINDAFNDAKRAYLNYKGGDENLKKTFKKEGRN